MGDVRRKRRARKRLIVAALVMLSILTGCLIGAAFDGVLPAQREAESPARAWNRLI